MKGVAVLVMAAVTLAAPDARTNKGAFQINRIQYTTDGGTGDPSTEVCVNDKDSLTNEESISLAILEASIPESELKNYKPSTGTLKDECVQFLAPKPSADGAVVYTLSVRDGETATHEQTAKVNFNFEELENGGEIDCGGQTFKVTVKDANCPDGDLEGTNNCYKPTTDLPSGDDKCVTPDPDNSDFQYCQPEADYTVYTQEEGDPTPAESLDYSGKLVLNDNTDNADKDVLVVVQDKDPQASTLVEESGKGTVENLEVDPSSAEYTVCPVVETFTAFKIKDLYVLATKQVEDEGTFYEFGLKLAEDAPLKYIASTPADGPGGDITMIINCESLAPEDRCYGWVKAGDKPLTVSYYDDVTDPSSPVISNNIILEPAAPSP